MMYAPETINKTIVREKDKMKYNKLYMTAVSTEDRSVHLAAMLDIVPVEHREEAINVIKKDTDIINDDLLSRKDLVDFAEWIEAQDWYDQDEYAFFPNGMVVKKPLNVKVTGERGVSWLPVIFFIIATSAFIGWLWS